MNSDLLKAILTMDSYHRSYGAGLNLNNNSVGNAVVISDSVDLGTVNGVRKDQASDFYAVAYSVGGETIIAYRGTDTAADIWNGWTGGIGNADSAQAHLAFEFYQTVAGTGNLLTANISLTGHSLGGGLAGLVGAIYDKDAVIFNSMAFEGAAEGTYDYAQKAYTNTAEEFEEQRADRIWEKAYLNQQPWQIDKVGIRSIATEGDVLAANRTLMNVPQTTLNFDKAIDLPGSLDKVSWHSMSTNVIRLFAATNGIADDWQESAPYFIPMLYDHSVGDSAGAQFYTGTLSANNAFADVMRAAIAYSAIDEGTRIFGDTGIRALFNDANDFGRVLKGGSDSALLTDNAEAISKLLVQYAGKLALSQILQSDKPEAINGVLEAIDDQAIVVDTSDATWAATGFTPSDGITRDELFDVAMSEAQTSAGMSAIELYGHMEELWGGGTSNPDNFDRLVFAAKDNGIVAQIPNAAVGNNGATLAVGGKGNDNIVGSSGKDLLVGGDGVDLLQGRAEADVLIGGLQNDILEGGEGNDVLLGGEGEDIYVFSSADGSFGDNVIHDDGKDDVLVIDGWTVDGWGRTAWKTVIDSQAGGYIGYENAADGLETEGKLNAKGFALEYDADSKELTLSMTAKGSITLVDWEQGDYGIYLAAMAILEPGSFFSPKDVIISDDIAKSLWDYTMGRTGGAGYSTPLVVDVTGVGLQLEELSQNGQFDIDGLGFAKYTGWTGENAGFIVMDHNQNGVIDNVTEMFGADGTQSAWAKLADYDSNNDGTVNAQDSNWSDIKIWVDADGDKRTDAGELRGPGDLGIHGFDLDVESYHVEGPAASGNIIDGRAAWLDANGNAAGHFYDVLFAVSNNDATYIGSDLTNPPVFDASTFLYPWHGGSGNVAPMHMALSANTTLHGMMDSFVELPMTTASTAVQTAVEDIILEWAQVNGVASNSRGALVDAQQVAALEKFLGIQFGSGAQYNNLPSWSVAELNAQQAAAFEAAWAELVDEITMVLQVQSTHADLFPNASYSFANAGIGKSLDFNDTVEDVLVRAQAEAPTNGVDANNYWSGLYGILKQGETTESLPLNGNAHFSAQDLLLAVQQAAGETVTISAGLPSFNIVTGTSGVDVLNGSEGPDIFVIEALHHSLRTGEAADTVIDFDPTTDLIQLKGLGFERLVSGDGASGHALAVRYDADRDVTAVFSEEEDFAIYLRGDLSEELHDGHFIYGITLRGDAAADTLTGTFIEELLLGNEGADTLNGAAGADTVEGGAGADVLTGGDGADIFRYTSLQDSSLTNNGYDRITDFAIGTDIIDLSALPFTGLTSNGVTAVGELRISYDSNLNLTFIRSDQEDFAIALQGNVSGTLTAASFRFSDVQIVPQNGGDGADTLTGAQGSDAISGHAGNDLLIGGEGNDYLSGGTSHDILMGDAGNDVLLGGDGRDLLVGGSGNNTLAGGNGDDIYRYASGDGNVVIMEVLPEYFEAQAVNTLQFAEGITVADLSVARNGNDAILTIDGAGTITIQHQFEFPFAIHQFQFADGTVLSAADIQAMAVTSSATSGNDYIIGIELAENFLQGLEGNDTLEGSFYSDTLDGGAGADVLTGGDGSDAFVISDVTHSVSTNGAYDRITDFNPEFWGGDDRIDVSGAGFAALTLDSTTQAGELRIEYDAVSDRTYVLSDQTDFAFYLDGEIALEDYHFIFYTAPDTSDTITGTNASEWLSGGNGDNTFVGGAGDDTIFGGTGNDSYVYNLGDGDDTISDDGGIDTLNFGVGITLNQLAFQRVGDDLVITIAGNNTVTIENYLSDWITDPFIETINYDGGVLTAAQIQSIILEQAATSGDDYIVGYNQGNTLAGGQGNDTLEGGTGNDTYLYNAGDDDLLITDQGGMDKLQFGAGISLQDVSFSRIDRDLVIEVAGNGTITVQQHFRDEYGYGPEAYANTLETIRFHNGMELTEQEVLRIVTMEDSHLFGTNGNDTLIGGLGADTLEGQQGNDTYVYQAGDGDDVVFDIGGTDTIVLGTEITSNDLTFSRPDAVGNDLLIDIASGGSVLLEKQFFFTPQLTGGIFDYQIETVVFDGGSITAQEIRDLFTQGTTGNDNLLGFWSDDTLTGGLGDDTLNGSSGRDTYIYNLGDGDDIVSGETDFGETNTLTFTTGINYSDLTFVRNGDDLVIEVAGGGSVTVINQFNLFAFQGITDVTYDGGSITEEDIRDILLQGTNGNDHLIGYETDDTIAGGLGNDTLTGEAGNDTFVFAADPNSTDVITDFTIGEDKIDLRDASLNAIQFANLTLSQDDADIVIGLGNGQTIRLEYADFESLTATDFLFATPQTNPFAGTSGNDTITGTVNAEVLEGLAGNDTLNAGGGNDTLIGGLGADVLKGEGGADIYRIADKSHSSASSTDVILGFSPAGGDKIDLNSLGFSDIHSGQSNAEGTALAYWFQYNDTFVGNADGSFRLRIDGEFTLTRNDFIGVGPDYAFTHVGTAGNDSLVGGAGDDVFDGGKGQDVLRGKGGSDIYFFDHLEDAKDSSPDTILDWDNSDVIDVSYLGFTGIQAGSANGSTLGWAVSGSYTEIFDSGKFLIRIHNGTAIGGSPNPTATNFIFSDGPGFSDESYSGTSGADTYATGLGNDVLNGNDGDDVLTGGGGHDTLDGGNGNDTLYGGDGDDTLFGQGGFDRLEAGAGNDRLIAGTNKDWLVGGSGNDTFSFFSDSHSSDTQPDTIADFVQGEDVIDIGTLSYTGIQSGAASGSVLGFSYQLNSSGQDITVIDADTGTFELVLMGQVNLANGDFVF